MKKAVFFDRDGVVNSDVGHYYIYKVEDFKINPGVIDGMKKLQDSGFSLVIITNQGGVAKGEYGEEDVAKVHSFLLGELRRYGVEIQGVYYCPHHDSITDCDCRKPSPKMILDAISDFKIDRSRSYLIGDSKRDIEAGESAGLKKCFKIDSNSSIIPIVEQILSDNE